MAFIIRHTSGTFARRSPAKTPAGCGSIRCGAQRVQSHHGVYGLDRLQPDGGTGISADERASCCRALANPNAGAHDLPGPVTSFR